MRFENDDVWSNFIKIAKEKGLISESGDAKKALEENPRVSSTSEKDMLKLYNVTPSKKNIIEEAHPEPVVIAPAYDKIHGLVENEVERQNITVNIINKPVTGRVTHHKYTQRDLLLTLVKVANHLDNQNEEQLRVLADSCIDQLTGNFKKEAIIGALPVVLAPVAPFLAGGGIIGKMYGSLASDISENDSLLEKLETVKKYASEVLQVVSNEKIIQNIIAHIDNAKPLIESMSDLRNTEINQTNAPKLKEDAAKYCNILSKLNESFKAFASNYKGIQENFKAKGGGDESSWARKLTFTKTTLEELAREIKAASTEVSKKSTSLREHTKQIDDAIKEARKEQTEKDTSGSKSEADLAEEQDKLEAAEEKRKQEAAAKAKRDKERLDAAKKRMEDRKKRKENPTNPQSTTSATISTQTPVTPSAENTAVETKIKTKAKGPAPQLDGDAQVPVTPKSAPKKPQVQKPTKPTTPPEEIV